jgi:hypothetical protein
MSKGTSPASCTAVRVYLKDQWWVTQDFYGRVLSAARTTIPSLTLGLAFRAEHICGANFWVALRPHEAKLAGRCVAHLVETGQLPLAFAKRKGTCLRYERV